MLTVNEITLTNSNKDSITCIHTINAMFCSIEAISDTKIVLCMFGANDRQVIYDYTHAEFINLVNNGHYLLSDIPNLVTELNKGCITYRGVGLSAPKQGTRIKVKGKEYFIENSLFNALGGINKMRFAAPTRKG